MVSRSQMREGAEVNPNDVADLRQARNSLRSRLVITGKKDPLRSRVSVSDAFTTISELAERMGSLRAEASFQPPLTIWQAAA